jgi:MFS superfamily sulfate permease-like transporter
MTVTKLYQKFGIPLTTLKNDFPASVVVFLVALPLCLGIALASGAPLFSGIIAGIVGGLVISVFSGAQLGVSGPAAGLTVIVLNAITEIGVWEGFLLAVVMAGVLQFILGYLRAGTIGNYFPSSVIKGMLAAIGIILIFKQIPHALGYDSDTFGDMDFFQRDHENTFSAIGSAIQLMNPGALIITAASLAILILWPRLKLNALKLVPAPLLVVILGVLLNELFKNTSANLVLSPEHLVIIPVATTVNEFFGLFTMPDWSFVSNPAVYKAAITLAIVASLETLLNAEAVDKLDPYKRNTPPNRELKAQGIGNIVSGLIGGLPLTAVIVRGAANVNAGAKTKASAFFHGLLLLLSVITIPKIINLIPYACLAAILLYTGYKLTKVSLYKSMFRAGRDQFVPFIVTVLAIVFTDLLIGITIGMFVGVFYILRVNMKNTYSYLKSDNHDGTPIKLILSEEVTFLNKASMLLTLENIPDNSRVIIDGTRSFFIDFDVLEIINDFKEQAVHRNIEVLLVNIKDNYKIENEVPSN